MKEFCGEIANDIQAKIITKHGQFLGVLGIIVSVIGLIVCLIIWLADKSLTPEIIKILVLVGISFLLYMICFVPTNKKKLLFKWNYHIKFENEFVTVISNHQNGTVQNYKITKIKKIIDYGRYYYLYLYKFDPSFGIVCQKDLLTKGTIEEFEKLFDSRIVRKLDKYQN